MIDDCTLRELNYKINQIIIYLLNNDGRNCLLYSHPPMDDDEPDSDIVEYAYDIKNIVNHLNNSDDDFPF